MIKTKGHCRQRWIHPTYSRLKLREQGIARHSKVKKASIRTQVSDKMMFEAKWDQKGLGSLLCFGFIQTRRLHVLREKPPLWKLRGSLCSPFWLNCGICQNPGFAFWNILCLPYYPEPFGIIFSGLLEGKSKIKATNHRKSSRKETRKTLGLP